MGDILRYRFIRFDRNGVPVGAQFTDSCFNDETIVAVEDLTLEQSQLVYEQLNLVGDFRF